MVKLLKGSDPIGLFFISEPNLTRSNDNPKAKFSPAINSIMEKFNSCASNEVTVSLIKCLHILLNGTETCHFNVRETTSMEYPISCVLFKVSNATSSDILENGKLAFGFRLLHYLLLL